MNDIEKKERSVQVDEIIRSLISLVIVGGFFAVVFLNKTNESLTMALGGVIGYYFGNRDIENKENKKNDNFLRKSN